jgi:type II secretory pathway pseudopilin PulG
MLEILVTVAVVALLAAAVAPRLFTWIDDGRIARAASDSATISASILRFYQDTRRFPGQVEILESPVIRFLTVGVPSATSFPMTPASTGITAMTVCADGLAGVNAGVTSFNTATPSPTNSINITGLLMVPPPAAEYPNWKGPYLSSELSSDPWGAVYLIHIIPMFCGETVTAANPGGNLGFGWVMSAGPNRTLQTPFSASRLDPESDDVGVAISKRVVQGS